MLDNINKEELLQYADGFFGDEEAAEEYLDERITFFESLGKDIELFRVIIAKSISDINLNKIGEHWTPDEYVLDEQFINYLQHECAGKSFEGKPFIVKTVYPISSINIELTLAQNLLNPDEDEIFIKEQSSHITPLNIKQFGELEYEPIYDEWTPKCGIDKFTKTEFTCGGCYALAQQIYEITGWPIYAEICDNDGFLHAWVQNDDGNAVDINGIHAGNWAKTKYSKDKPSGNIVKYTPNDPLCSDYSSWAKDIIDNFPSHFGLEKFKLKKDLLKYSNNTEKEKIKYRSKI